MREELRVFIEMGLECGLSEEYILEKLQQKLKSWQKAQEYFHKYAAETV